MFSGTTTLLANDFQYNTGSPTQNALPPGQQIVQETLTFAMAVSMDLVEQFILTVQVLGAPAASFTADFSHTGHLFIDPFSAGASYTTASGNLFLTLSTPVAAVPEPTTTASLPAGLGTLALFTAHRRRPRAHGRAQRGIR